MSSHTLIPLDGASASRTIRVGWDAPLSTFFASVWDEPADEGAESDHLVFAGGAPYDISDPATVVELVTPYAVVPQGLREQLLADRAREGDGFQDRPATELVATTSLPYARSTQQADAIRAALR
ncbi:hypothetical protein K388_07121 [Streptomyces sp. KhCrAH-43]|uniref:hypothetical protein n=1 Tax=unclassified Streptomyces TaxID=2593676 RepID=UPI0003711E1E|nr:MULTISPECIES: hypothetical protein [unclassified Streptomyces]MYS36339.1 hypothetical protein [Streptomyces sp. SID4920]MYX63994.1 hypothetical protein [Streptomyces sp. SID8373]RAJ47844.1 hypothetical protein K388_07121 [Streptomyces sp. KhCrAH-43]